MVTAPVSCEEHPQVGGVLLKIPLTADMIVRPHIPLGKQDALFTCADLSITPPVKEVSVSNEILILLDSHSVFDCLTKPVISELNQVGASGREQVGVTAGCSAQGANELGCGLTVEIVKETTAPPPCCSGFCGVLRHAAFCKAYQAFG